MGIYSAKNSEVSIYGQKSSYFMLYENFIWSKICLVFVLIELAYWTVDKLL